MHVLDTSRGAKRHYLLQAASWRGDVSNVLVYRNMNEQNMLYFYATTPKRTKLTFISKVV
jgi:hypothetical protein